ALQGGGFRPGGLLAAMAAGGAAAGRLRVDGGMVANDWLCQFLADVLDRPVNRPKTIETTALGAAALAAAGPDGDLGDVHQALGEGQTFTPELPQAKRAALLEGWRRAVRQTLAGT
ncbi:MAG: FGGY-family carbohydrate kinase, partial [Gammaproteobacteria bacterium]|nr:FGGY-family carbohydrate kinase [Gammaproteobacteria bacterium]